MACDIPRTARDDARDALAALDNAERALVHWRAHLERVQAGGELADALQARRVGRTVTALVNDAEARTRGAVHRAEVPADALPVA